MHGLLSVLGGETFVRLYFNQGFNIDVHRCRHVSKCLHSYWDSRKEALSGYVFSFFSFFPGWWLRILGVFVEQSSIPYGCQSGWITVSSPSEKYWDAEDNWKSSLYAPLYAVHTFNFDDFFFFCRRSKKKKSNKSFCSGTCVWTEAIQGKSQLQICYIDTGENVLNST